jgi:hypothetical protein
MKYTQSIATIDNNLLYLVVGEDSKERAAFYYVLVDKLKRDIFLKDIHNPDIDLRRFGKILISGFGREPTEDAKAYLKDHYNLKVD